MYRDYASRGVKFYFIYKSLAHPELVGDYVQPFTHDERLAHARQAAAQLGATIPWLVDAIDNRLKHAMGDRPNSEFVIDPRGIIVRKRAWSDPSALRADLEELVGSVESITRPEDLNLTVKDPLTVSAPKKVVERVSRAGLFPLVCSPDAKGLQTPFYAKLRAEADVTVIDEGQGRLYLGFHLDPFHQAHWNNLRQPLRFQLDVPAGIKLSQTTGEATPPENVEVDSDPREFLLEVESWPEDQAIHVTVTYAACTEDACHQVQQQYVLHRRRDRDGGRAGPAGFRGLEPEAMIKILMGGDSNGDGRLVKEELNSVNRPRFHDHDLNSDGVLDQNEVRKMAEKQSEKMEP